MSLAKQMGDKHEEFLAERLDGRKTRGSGNQPANPMDGRHSRYDRPVAWAWDGKSTRAASISITLGMIAKAIEQAHGERWLFALRFYHDDRLKRYDDVVVMSFDDFEELNELAQKGRTPNA